MEIRILGPFEVRADGRRLDIGGPRPRALLAVLLLHADEIVPADRLVDELWGEAPPPSAHHLLHVYVSSLRKALRQALPQPLLLTHAPGYRLDLADGAVDARRFERLLGDGTRLLPAGEPERAAEALRAALGLWHGPALAEFVYEPFAQNEIARLEELRLVAREELVEASLALGRHGELVAELEASVAEHPLRERPRAQLMLALYRSGRQSEALEVFRATRRTLVDELGIEPSPTLRRLEQAILRHDATLELEPPRSVAHAGRKLVTVLVATIADARRLDRLDPEARRKVVTSVLETARTILTAHGATVDALPDERVLAVFGVPVAHEDDALRAARAAVELRALPELRIGIESGEAIVAGTAVTGEPFVRASRLANAAARNAVLLGRKTHRLVRHAVLAETDPARDELLLLAVLPEASAFPRPRELPLVGRERELAELVQAFETAVADRAFRLVTLVGAAGVGKSRLARELASLVRDRASTLVGRSVPYGEGVAYLPLREIVRQAAGAETRAAVRTVLPANAERETVASAVVTAIGGDERARSREEMFWAVRRMVEALGRERPLLLLLEDLHWAEPAWLDLVLYLAESTRKTPVLGVCLGRPELVETRADWPSARVLEPLSRAESETLVVHLVGAADLPKEACATIVDAAGGNPLFLEQMLAMLADDERSPDEVALPPTIRAVLTARLDRLGPGERAVLERAAVVGPTVDRDAVVALLTEDAHASIDRHVHALVRKDFLRTDGGGFRFGHAVVREAAYASISKELRADLHERLGDWLAATGGGESVAGYHLERSFRLHEELRAVDWHARKLAERAAGLLGEAGLRALARDDAPSAADLLGRAAALIGEDDPDRLELLPRLVEALREVPDLDVAANVAEETVVAAAAARDARAEAFARIERAHVRLMRERAGAVEHAAAEGERAVAIFTRLNDDLGLARAWRLVAMANRLLGRQSTRREALESALVHARRTGDLRTETWIFDGLGGVHNYGPSTVTELLQYAEQSLAWARANEQRSSEAHALAQGFGRAYAMLGEFDRARGAVADAQAIADDLGFVWHRAGVASAAGFVERLAGDFETAERELRAGLELIERSGMTGSYYGMALREELAEVLYALGRYEQAGELCELSERQAPQDDVQAQVQWRALRAKLKARAGTDAEAEDLARTAVALAERTELVLVQANAVLDLAEVLRLSGRDREAHDELERARLLFEAKGDRMSAARAGAVLAS